MPRGKSARETSEVPDGDVHSEQFEMLKDFILEEDYSLEDIEGWKLSEMKRPDRRTVQRLIDFFQNDM